PHPREIGIGIGPEGGDVDIEVRRVGHRVTTSYRPVAAIRHHNRAGDIGRQIGGEEDRGADDVFRFAGTAERGVVEEYLHQLRIVGTYLGIQRRLDQAGADGVDAD